MTTRITRRWLRERHTGGPDVQIPIVEILGARPGSSVAFSSGMHGGEYAGQLRPGGGSWHQLLPRLVGDPRRAGPIRA